MNEIKKLTVEEFNDLILENKKTVLVDFFASWCGPCKMLAPILEEVNSENDTDTLICKVDVDECFDIAKSYGVMSVPTLVLFADGKEKSRAIGLKNKEFILNLIKNS